MKAVFPYLLVAVLAAAVAILLMRGCSKTTLPQPDNAAVDSVTKAYGTYKSFAQANADSLEDKLLLKDDTIDNLSREMAWDEAQLSDQGDQIDATMRMLDSARARHDTIQVVISCDSLEGQVRVAQSEAIIYRGTVDSLLNVLDRQGQTKDSLTASWKSMFLHADTAQAFLQTRYNSLYVDYGRQSAKLKITSTTGKVLGGAVAALLLGLLIKK